MRTHHPGSTRSRFVLAAVISAGALSVGACAQPAAVGVAGRHAVRFETASTDAGLYQAGTRYAVWKTVGDKAPRTLTAASHSPAHPGCVPIRPGTGFYEGGRVGTEELTTPTSRCTTISVSNIVDSADPADRCQTFLVGFWPLVDGSLTYTEPVTACGGKRTVLARNVPDNAKFLVLYDVDYIDPCIQTVRFKVWR